MAILKTDEYLTIDPEIRNALDTGQPIVALESTIIAHGMPYPTNIETAKKVETIIREEGAIPAIIAILDGELIVGLNEHQLESVAKKKDVMKVSRRDLPMMIAKKLNGATTVAATMFIAARAGIRIFVTGGIGGVHRGAEESFDISADLIELASTDVAVVCAGAKAILDIGLTLEFLETHGVPVIGYQTDDFPAFYCRKSGFAVDYCVNSPGEIAKMLQTKWNLGLQGGIVVANSIPQEHELNADLIETAIAQALEEANEQQISGKDTTPFLLTRIEKITGGKSLKANIELVCNNARLGARLALEYARLHNLI